MESDPGKTTMIPSQKSMIDSEEGSSRFHAQQTEEALEEIRILFKDNTRPPLSSQETTPGGDESSAVEAPEIEWVADPIDPIQISAKALVVEAEKA